MQTWRCAGRRDELLFGGGRRLVKAWRQAKEEKTARDGAY